MVSKINIFEFHFKFKCVVFPCHARTSRMKDRPFFFYLQSKGKGRFVKRIYQSVLTPLRMDSKSRKQSPRQRWRVRKCSIIQQLWTPLVSPNLFSAPIFLEEPLPHLPHSISQDVFSQVVVMDQLGWPSLSTGSKAKYVPRGHGVRTEWGRLIRKTPTNDCGNDLTPPF